MKRIPLVIRARCRKSVYNVAQLFRGFPFKGILIVPREIGTAIGDPSRPLAGPLENLRVRERATKGVGGRKSEGGTRVAVVHGKEMQSAM